VAISKPGLVSGVICRPVSLYCPLVMPALPLIAWTSQLRVFVHVESLYWKSVNASAFPLNSQGFSITCRCWAPERGRVTENQTG
jgi:hypothetical protein